MLLLGHLFELSEECPTSVGHRDT